ncbi:NARFL [Cordylochernes scorpioides]|uniref:NARFL n=1 Tax=Cordylochernes scorpioides TaxID=51811 RepID=A0ABY6KB81_9ARAC|nr:NARFL [Cordylochernes scorpioides]
MRNLGMSEGFSSALRLTDLNDFIHPSQECTKPVEVKKPKIKGSKIKIGISNDGLYSQVDQDGDSVQLKKAQITLQDCLACSGCITSAESILITKQSNEEFLNIIKENKDKSKDYKTTIVVSISPQTFASFAAKWNLSIPEVSKKLSTFFKQQGIDYVFDTTFARDFSLYETANEFLERFKHSSSKNQLPLLTSACPGWICYAEKTHGEYILPYISTTKSPQQIIGSLVKDYLAVRLNKPTNLIYHLTVMPCFDKKLEASRDDFYNDIYKTRDVDCVITSLEVDSLITEQNVDLTKLPDSPIDSFDQTADYIQYSHSGSGSGGYCEYVFKRAAKELYQISSVPLNYRIKRNKDFLELSLEQNGEIVLNFAIATGFRNIQTIVRNVKQGRCNYHFVEIMACPSGCLNGGAQVRDKGDKVTPEFLKKMEEVYHAVPCQLPEENQLVHQIYSDWLEGPNSPKAKIMLHTQYHAREKISNGLEIKCKRKRRPWLGDLPIFKNHAPQQREQRLFEVKPFARASISLVTKMEDQRICIKFCVKNGFKGAEIFWMLQTAYGDAVMSRRRAFKWYKRFKEGREETADNERSGRPSTSTTPEKVDKVLELVREDRRITVREVTEEAGISFGSTQLIMKDILGVRRLNAVLVPKDLTFDKKNARKETASLNLEATTDDPELLKRVITGDETWIRKQPNRHRSGVSKMSRDQRK